ncbi:Terpenoid synthase [Mycena indigotica]|uniref:Terpenoid synthase n=1 Tax=Mycena indigotica TaxID=2126181 RepID=A0A8H6WEG1_9AGAR|nr:Terpenoid synthase [Mycena indigotica]KAF7309429.1 Terpenoid synthase [Mycena indigotica]
MDLIKISQAVKDVLSLLNIDVTRLSAFDDTPTLEPFALECIAEAYKRGYLSRDKLSSTLQESHIRIGAAVGHYVWLRPAVVPHKVAILGSLLMGQYYCVDDCCFSSQSLVEYGARLVAGRSQLDKGLDHITEVNCELADMYPAVVGDMLRMSHQAYMTGNYLEGQMASEKGLRWTVQKDTPLFPTIMKTMTSVATSLYLLSFPPDLHFTSYLQTIPDGIIVHINTADIMSYYKEAIDQEFNRVEQIAQLHHITGSEMLESLVTSTTVSHSRVLRSLLEADPSGRLASCHEKAIQGFVTFQALHHRYKLRKLGVIPVA